MSGLLDRSKLDALPAVRSWLDQAESTHRIITENYSHLTDAEARLTATVEENVLVQLENLRTHPAVAAAIGRKAPHIHGWVYKFETGQVFGYRADSGQFVALDDQSCFPVDQESTVD